MSKSVFILLYAFLFIYSCDNEPVSGFDAIPTENTQEVFTFGGDKNDSAQSVVATTDGGYILLGHTQSSNADITDKEDDSFDYWVLKFDNVNQLQWQKTYGGSGDDRGRKIIQTQDGGYAVLGTSNSTNFDVTENNGAQDYWLAKLDNLGNVSWQKSFGFQGNDTGISMIQTSDLGYLLVGVLDVTASNGAGNTSRLTTRHAGGNYWALKLDASGNLEWSKFYGGNFTDTPEGVVETDNGDFIIAGGSDSTDTDITNNKGAYDFWVIRISANGDLVWEKSFGGDEIDEAKAILKANDGNIVIAGDTRSNNQDVSGTNGAADIWLIKISPEGDLIWEKTYGGTSFDVSRDLQLTQDGGLLLAGSSRSSDGDVSENKGQNDAWVIKVDSDGNLQWETSIGGSNIDFAYGVTELNDQSVIGVGDTSSNDGDIIENKGFTDVLVFKIEKN